jgi:hypothetical protein
MNISQNRARKSKRSLSFLFILVVSLAGCASPRVTTPGESAKTYIFPYGKYQHDVQLTILGDAGDTPTHQHLNGLVKIDANTIQIVGLSPFGTTVFKISDHLDTGKIEDEIYLPQLKAHADRVLAFYQVLKKLLLLKKDHSYHEGSAIEVEPGTEFIFGAFDKNQIPKKMTIHSAHFEVEIEVTRYDF